MSDTRGRGGQSVSDEYFQLFGLPEGFDIDLGELSQRYRHLQRSLHPDRFAQASQREQRLAVQRAALINDAYDTLKDPVKRAKYLLRRRGLNVDQDSPQLDSEFLMQQMNLREALEQARTATRPEERLAQLHEQAQACCAALQGELASALEDGSGETLQDAAVLVHKLQFFHKLLAEIEQLEHELDD